MKNKILTTKIINKLKLIEREFDCKFILGGGIVLNNLGIIDREPGDIDLIVYCDCNTFWDNKCNLNHFPLVKKFKFLSKLLPLDKKDNYYYYGSKEENVIHLRFMLDGVKICVFLTDKQEYCQIVRSKYRIPFLEPQMIINFKKKYVNSWLEKNSKQKGYKETEIPPSIQKHYNDIKSFNEWLKKRNNNGL